MERDRGANAMDEDALPNSLEGWTDRALGPASAVAALFVLATSVADLSDGYHPPLEAATYVFTWSAAALTYLCYRRRLIGSIAVGLVADTILTCLLLIRLWLDAASVSGTAMFLVIKMMGMAVLIPWGGTIQLASAATTVALYTVLLMQRPDAIAPRDRLDQLAAPALAALISIGGAQLAARSRAEFARASERLAHALRLARAAENENAALLDSAREVTAVAGKLVAAVGKPDLLSRLCVQARGVLGCDVVAVYLRSADGTVFTLRATDGLSDDEIEPLRSLSIPADVMERQSRQFGSASWQSALPEKPSTVLEAFALRYGVTQLLRVPLYRGEEVVGILTASYRGRREPFSTHQEQAARSIGQFASLVWENNRLIAELEHANRLQADFVATMSHELRTPLNIILGYAHLLLEREFGEITPDQSMSLTRIERSGQELLELVGTTLHVGRLDAGAVPLEVTRFNLAELIDEVSRETRELWERDGLDYQVSLPSEPIGLNTDRAKLKVVLKNLIGNAAKFTERGSIRVEATRRGDRTAIAVRDTGIGISPEVLPIIFDRFRQADSSTTRRFGGVGLGLYIVRRLVTMLGGDVEVESTAGEGSVFTVSLRDKAASAIGSAARDALPS